MKDINDYTLRELQEMEVFESTKPFRWVVIVPIDEIHGSGYRCMKFILGNGSGDICGVIDAGSDVVNPNGVGGMGKDWDISLLQRGLAPNIGLSMDCLAGSSCVRLMTNCSCEPDSFIGSNFAFYGMKEGLCL